MTAVSTGAAAPSVLFRNAQIFDGTRRAPMTGDVLVKQGRIAAIGEHLTAEDAQIVDCSGQWLTPGLLDIHTHLDLEVELAPGLEEVVRHGTTTVVMSNCSLGVAYGNQRRGSDDPITDCFARVENIPKHVLRKVGDVCTWKSSSEYLTHFDSLALGPNVVPLIPHSMLRIEVMGLKDSVTRQPSPQELDTMEQLLEKAMDEGYPGFSTDGLPFHFLANQPHTRKQIPTQFAPFRELKRLTDVLRRRDRVWQATPPKDSTFQTVRNFLLTSGVLFGKPLRVTATAAIDLYTNSGIAKLGVILSRVLNSFFIRGHFRFQALSASFRLWSDGVITPVAEEIPELRVLNELELDDRAGRLAILNDPTWMAQFRTMWFKGKSGFNLANLRRLLNREDNVLNRKLADMSVAQCPLPAWTDKSLEHCWQQMQRWQANPADASVLPEEKTLFEQSKQQTPVHDDADFFLFLLRQWDTQLRWTTVIANRDPKTTKKLLFHPLTLPGFNDSGAHLTNLAFYDGNLRTLKFAQEDGAQQVAYAVHRLTQAPAEFFNLNTGILKVGAQADLCVVDPEALARWNPENTYAFVDRPLFESRQVVNRPEGVVKHVMIAGRHAWVDGQATAELGTVTMGRVLRTLDHPAEQKFNAITSGSNGYNTDSQRFAQTQDNGRVPQPLSAFSANG
jgi:N-acyl-D-aspartate/D-glutamate deacylase